jgi:hypothetical protein
MYIGGGSRFRGMRREQTCGVVPCPLSTPRAFSASPGTCVGTAELSSEQLGERFATELLHCCLEGKK